MARILRTASSGQSATPHLFFLCSLLFAANLVSTTSTWDSDVYQFVSGFSSLSRPQKHTLSSSLLVQNVEGSLDLGNDNPSVATEIARAKAACQVSKLVFDLESESGGYVDETDGAEYTNRTEVN